jgi:hypothetical protein
LQQRVATCLLGAKGAPLVFLGQGVLTDVLAAGGVHGRACSRGCPLAFLQQKVPTLFFCGRGCLLVFLDQRVPTGVLAATGANLLFCNKGCPLAVLQQRLHHWCLWTGWCTVACLRQRLPTGPFYSRACPLAIGSRVLLFSCCEKDWLALGSAMDTGPLPLLGSYGPYLALMAPGFGPPGRTIEPCGGEVLSAFLELVRPSH